MLETSHQPHHTEEEEECCWICLQPENAVLGQLEQPCACPRYCHVRCLSRWQLQSAGRSEEKRCRFCNAAYEDWRQHLPPRVVPPRPATPIMAIFFEGQTHRLKVYPGPEGKARFEQQIRDLIHLGDNEEFDISFECKAPDTGTLLHLDGMNAFDAATHCASLTAAERITKQLQQEQEAQQQQQQQPQPDNVQEPLDVPYTEADYPDLLQDSLQEQPDYMDQDQHYYDDQDYDPDYEFEQHEMLQHELGQLEQQLDSQQDTDFDAASVPVGVAVQYTCPGAEPLITEVMRAGQRH